MCIVFASPLLQSLANLLSKTSRVLLQLRIGQGDIASLYSYIHLTDLPGGEVDRRLSDFFVNCITIEFLQYKKK